MIENKNDKKIIITNIKNNKKIKRINSPYLCLYRIQNLGPYKIGKMGVYFIKIIWYFLVKWCKTAQNIAHIFILYRNRLLIPLAGNGYREHFGKVVPPIFLILVRSENL